MLGITEAPFYPGAIYLVSLFYTRKETATRLALFYTGNLLSSTFSGLIAAGVFTGLDGVRGLVSSLESFLSPFGNFWPQLLLHAPETLVKFCSLW